MHLIFTTGLRPILVNFKPMQLYVSINFYFWTNTKQLYSKLICTVLRVGEYASVNCYNSYKYVASEGKFVI